MRSYYRLLHGKFKKAAPPDLLAPKVVPLCIMAPTTPAAAPTADAKPRMSKERLRRSLRIFDYVWQYRWLFILSFIILGLSSLVFLVLIQLPGEALNVYNGKGKYGLTVDEVFLLLAALVVMQAPLSFYRVRIQAIVSERAMASLRKDLFAKILHLNIPFFERSRVGELSSRITNDITQIQGVFSLTLTEFARQIIILLGATVFILVTMFRLALVSLIVFPWWSSWPWYSAATSAR